MCRCAQCRIRYSRYSVLDIIPSDAGNLAPLARTASVLSSEDALHTVPGCDIGYHQILRTGTLAIRVSLKGEGKALPGLVHHAHEMTITVALSRPKGVSPSHRPVAVVLR